MKNFKIYIYMLISVFLFSMTGCYELDRYPLDKLNSGIFWQDEAQAHQGLMGVYSRLKQSNAFGRKFMIDAQTDIGYGSHGQSYQQLSNGAVTVNTDFVVDTWKDNYEGIAQANTFILNVTEMTDEQIDPAVKAGFIADAKFLRALFYNELLTFYGGVPIYDETTDIGKEFADMLKPRDTEEAVRAFIVQDLTDAAAVLPATRTGNEKGRPTASSAYALRGKVYLFNKEYDKALADFNEVVDPKYGHELYNDFAGLFKPGGDESSEMIFAIQNLSNSGQVYGMQLPKYLGTRTSYGSCWGNSSPSNDLFNMYEYKDGSDIVWDDVFPGFDASDDVKKEVFHATLGDDGMVTEYPKYRNELLDFYTQLDPRCAATLITPYTEYLGWVQNKGKTLEWILTRQAARGENGYIFFDKPWYLHLWRKFVPEGNMDGLINSRDHSPTNFPLIRLADVYLMMAECYNQKSSPDQTMAAEYVNKVRSRASVDMPAITETSQEDIFTRIVRERAVELACEGLRWNDLQRWEMLEDIIPGAVIEQLTGEVLQNREASFPRDYLFPIPQGEMDINPEMVQNPGW